MSQLIVYLHNDSPKIYSVYFSTFFMNHKELVDFMSSVFHTGHVNTERKHKPVPIAFFPY